MSATAPKSLTTQVLTNISRAKAVGEEQKSRGGMEYMINSMMLISIVGMCIKIFFSSPPTDADTGPANAVIYGYGIVALSIIAVMFISYGIHDRIGKIENKGKFITIINLIKSFLTSSMPSILTVSIMLWVVSLNITYFTQINRGTVAAEYYMLSTGTAYLFVFQLICLFQYLKVYIQTKTDKTKAGEQADKTQNRIAFATYFLSMINFVIVGMMTIILQFFSTDG
jgi:hypothetical protein